MNSIPAIMWNQLQKSQTLEPLWVNKLAQLNEEALDNAIITKQAQLNLSVSRQASRAYLLTAPLLLNSQMISRFISKHSLTEWRSMLPEIISVAEAIHLANREMRLRVSEMEELKQLLMGDLLVLSEME